MVLIKSRSVMEEVIEDLNLELSYAELQNLLTVTNPQDTRILVITVRYKSPKEAKRIVDKITEVGCNRIEEIMDLERPNIIQYGYVPTSSCNVNVQRYMALAGLAGIGLSMGGIILLYLLDDTLKKR